MMLTSIATLGLITIAAVTDWRKGEIPNWLTLPPLLIAPFFWWCENGVEGAEFSLVALIGCGLVPYMAFRLGAMGGGDVKLFAAIGAINGFSLGFEVLMMSLLAALAQTFVVLARSGHLLACLRNCVVLTTNVFLPSRYRREVPLTTLTELRMGPAILVGYALSLVTL